MRGWFTCITCGKEVHQADVIKHFETCQREAKSKKKGSSQVADETPHPTTKM